jgi:hypothetical protein
VLPAVAWSLTLPGVFRPRHNTMVRALVSLAILGVAGTIGGLMLYARTPYARGTDEPVPQPLQFDHRHHARDDQIDCRFCHNTVEKSSFAGLPSTELCLGCHSQIWNQSPITDVLRESFFAGRPLRWNRVYKVMEFAYFDHSVHVSKGVGCVTCHGRVDLMPAVTQVTPLTMGWCLGCHRDPAPHLRPLAEITSMTWQAPEDPARFGAHLAQELGVATRTSCTTCHR